MRIVSASDWRDGIAFDTPIIVASVFPGDDTRCSVCGGDSPLRPRTELWAVKHRHPKHHDGHVRFYCSEHVPAPPARPATPAGPSKTARRPAAPRRAPAVERAPRTMCPDCFIEVAADGTCGMCGWSAA